VFGLAIDHRREERQAAVQLGAGRDLVASTGKGQCCRQPIGNEAAYAGLAFMAAGQLV
jgi:hypothetical protein